jgi:hypothetical protein
MSALTPPRSIVLSGASVCGDSRAWRIEMQSTARLNIEETCDLVRAEYSEMPGLCLTHQQIQRLWNLDAEACDAVLSHLMAVGFLHHSDRDEYIVTTNEQ